MVKHSDVDIKLNGTVVTFLCVVGFAVESFLARAIHARKGFGALRWHHVPTVTVRDAVVNGRCRKEIEVAVPRDAAELALRVAQAVCERLRKAGVLLLDAIIPQLNDAAENPQDRKASAGEHDLIGERMPLNGLSSIEVKVRTVKKEHFLPIVRKQIQNLAYKLWPAATAKASHGWAERVVVLVQFADAKNQDWGRIFCDSLMAGRENLQENWKPLFGWGGSLPPFQGRAPGQQQLQRSQAQQPSPQPTRSQPAAPRPAVITPQERQRKRAFESIYANVRKVELHNQEMGSVSDLLSGMRTPAAKRAKPTIGEKIRGWADRFGWPAHSWAQSPKFRSKNGGGRWGFAASQGALDDVHRHLNK